MSRIPFSQVLKNAKIDIRREYDRLYSMFYVSAAQYKGNATLKDLCSKCFLKLPSLLRGTCITLNDFDDFYGYRFEEIPHDFDLDYLVSFCEYSYNLVFNSYKCLEMNLGEWHFSICLYIEQIKKVIETIGYMANTQNSITDFVPKDQVAISVAEIVDSSLSYRVIEYNHHSMRGDLERKREILLALADKLEPMHQKLRHINASLDADISFLLNNLNVRHNNKDIGKNQNPVVMEMDEETLEHWYDDIYQTLLLAFLELDHLDRKDRIKQLKEASKEK